MFLFPIYIAAKASIKCGLLKAATVCQMNSTGRVHYLDIQLIVKYLVVKSEIAVFCFSNLVIFMDLFSVL